MCPPPVAREKVLHPHFTPRPQGLLRVTRKRVGAKEPLQEKVHKAGAPTVCMHVVSGSISLPSRGSFRLSLTVLVHYRSITSI
jgi:hypothetical protein